MLTRKQAFEMVKWADENNVKLISLFWPHIVFMGLCIVAGIMMVVML